MPQIQDFINSFTYMPTQRYLIHKYLYADAEIVKLLLSSADKRQRQGGVELTYADPTRPE